MRNRGFALVTVLVISTAILIMGMGAMYMSEMGFRSISAESRWHLVEKAANAGLMQTAGNIARGQFNCGGQQNLNLNGANVEVRTTSSGGACFLWARATLGNASVVKVGVLTAGNPSTNHGAAVFRSLNNISVGGSGAITSCDPNCRTSALVIGNSLNNPPTENLVSTCPNNPKGVTALVDPYVPNAFPTNTDLTNRVFNNINNRTELQNTLRDNYKVQFNNGTPSGITGTHSVLLNQNGQLMLPLRPPNDPNPPSLDVCVSHCDMSVELAGGSVFCRYSSDPGSFLQFNWSNGRYVVTQWMELDLTCDNPPCPPRGGRGMHRIIRGTVAACNHLDFLNYDINVISNFTGGNNIAGGGILLNAGASSPTGYTLNLIAREQAFDNANGLNFTNVNLFAKNITFDNQNLTWNGGILYSGGAGVGNFNINLRSNSSLGTSTNPVLIISDNNINIQRNGNAEINGLVFATSSNNNFSIGAGNGNFSINGMVFSNSTSNNNINISGNFSINFNANILRTLSQRYSFLRPPDCTANVSVSIPFMQTKTTTY